jgi:hypothetical protein
MLEKPEEWTIQRHWQHCILKTGQYRDTGNIVHTRHRTKTNKTQKLTTTQHRKLKKEQHEPPPKLYYLLLK